MLFVFFRRVLLSVPFLTVFAVALQPVLGETGAVELPPLQRSPTIGAFLALLGKEVSRHVLLVLSYP